MLLLRGSVGQVLCHPDPPGGSAAPAVTPLAPLQSFDDSTPKKVREESMRSHKESLVNQQVRPRTRER